LIKLTIDYGYDIHSIELDDQTHAQIKAGEKVRTEGQGFWHEEDGEVKDYWKFNQNPGEIYFSLENGAEFFAQNSWIED
jgi:hypothetical protein